jgi:hypothetical protein
VKFHVSKAKDPSGTIERISAWIIGLKSRFGSGREEIETKMKGNSARTLFDAL